MSKNVDRLSKALPGYTDEQAEEVWKCYRWKDGKPVCPFCHSQDRQYACKSGKYSGKYKCAHCNRRYSSFSGTVFQYTKLSFAQIMRGLIFLLQQKAESAIKLANIMGVNYDTAYFFIKRLQMATHQDIKLSGIVAMDEVYLGGRWKNKHLLERLKIVHDNDIIPKDQTWFTQSEAAQGMSVSRCPVFGENDGEHIWLQQLPSRFDSDDLKEIFERTCTDVTLCVSDDPPLYNGWKVPLEINCHSKKQYRTPNGHSSNAIEGVFAHLRRRIEAVHIHCAEKYLQLYLNWFSFTWNYRKQSLLERLAALMRYISSRICPFRNVLAYDALAKYRERDRLREESDRQYAKKLLQQAGALVREVEVSGKTYTREIVNCIN